MTKDPGVLDNESGIKLCRCHGEPLMWTVDHRDMYPAGGYWRCAVKIRAGLRARYAKLDGVTYNRKLLQHRRHKALVRQRVRRGAVA